MNFIKFHNTDGQSAVELAIFGSILMFIIAMIFRQGFNAGHFMDSQLKAERYAMSKSLEMSERTQPGRNTTSSLIVEDRLAGDFAGKFGSRDRTALVSSSSATFSSQMFYPVDMGDWDNHNQDALTRTDVVVNGQAFSFTTSGFVPYNVAMAQGGFTACGVAHAANPATGMRDTRCWKSDCVLDINNQPQGCVVFQQMVQNFPGSPFDPNSPRGFDLDFDGVTDVPAGNNPFVTDDQNNPISYRQANDGTTVKNFGFMWQWREVAGLAANMSTNMNLDVDGDFYEEQVLGWDTDPLGRVTAFYTIDHQAGDMDTSADSRRPDFVVGLTGNSQMFSYTQDGTFLRLDEGRLFDPRDGRFIRNANRNNQVDIVQRTIQLSNDTHRFCANGQPVASVDYHPNPVEACDSCFSALNLQKTCFDSILKKIYVRSRIENKSGRSWTTQTSSRP